MEAKASRVDFRECTDLITAQRYGPALESFKGSIRRLRDAKVSPGRSKVARQLFEVATALEESLEKAYGEKWHTLVPEVADEGDQSRCSFCGKDQSAAKKLIAGPSVFICDDCVELCHRIVRQKVKLQEKSKPSQRPKKRERLCGICTEPHDENKLIFLPHAAYMCGECLEAIQTLREQKRGN
jgi:hypothetical protein